MRDALAMMLGLGGASSSSPEALSEAAEAVEIAAAAAIEKDRAQAQTVRVSVPDPQAIARAEAAVEVARAKVPASISEEDVAAWARTWLEARTGSFSTVRELTAMYAAAGGRPISDVLLGRSLRRVFPGIKRRGVRGFEVRLRKAVRSVPGVTSKAPEAANGAEVPQAGMPVVLCITALKAICAGEDPSGLMADPSYHALVALARIGLSHLLPDEKEALIKGDVGSALPQVWRGLPVAERTEPAQAQWEYEIRRNLGIGSTPRKEWTAQRVVTQRYGMRSGVLASMSKKRGIPNFVRGDERIVTLLQRGWIDLERISAALEMREARVLAGLRRLCALQQQGWEGLGPYDLRRMLAAQKEKNKTRGA